MNWAEIIAASPAVAVGILLVGVVATYLKVQPELRRIKLEGDTSLRADLMERIGALEANCAGLANQLAVEREQCAERIDELVARHEQAMSALEQRYDRSSAEFSAQVQVLRHERNNSDANFNALILLLEHLRDAPDKLDRKSVV